MAYKAFKEWIKSIFAFEFVEIDQNYKQINTNYKQIDLNKLKKLDTD